MNCEDPLEKERKWKPTPVFLPGESQGQRNLAGYSQVGCKRDGYNLATKEKQQTNKDLTYSTGNPTHHT